VALETLQEFSPDAHVVLSSTKRQDVQALAVQIDKMLAAMLPLVPRDKNINFKSGQATSAFLNSIPRYLSATYDKGLRESMKKLRNLLISATEELSFAARAEKRLRK